MFEKKKMKKGRKKEVFVWMLFFMISGTLFAQNSPAETNKHFIGDARIDTLIQLHILQNKKFPVMPGFRIQIFKESGNTALDEALAVREQFEKKYNLPAYITFNEPYYRVRVGDFRTRLEAIRFLEKIKRTYPLAWDIKDDIQIPK